MLIALRILFGAIAVYFVREAMKVDHSVLVAGDTTPAYYLGVFVVIGIFNAFVWAPYLGRKVSDPLTAMLTESTFEEHSNWFLRFVRWHAGFGFRPVTVALAFLECVHKPDLPAGFILGLAFARPGSWLEKVFARELFRFDNLQHSIWAFRVLKRHGVDPRPHKRPEINLALMAHERVEKPEPARLPVPVQNQPVRLRRNSRIQLFKPESPTPTNPKEESHVPLAE